MLFRRLDDRIDRTDVASSVVLAGETITLQKLIGGEYGIPVQAA